MLGLDLKALFLVTVSGRGVKAMTHASETGVINRHAFFWRRFLVRICHANSGGDTTGYTPGQMTRVKSIRFP